MSTTIKNHSHSPSKRNMNHEEAHLAKAGISKTNAVPSKSSAVLSKRNANSSKSYAGPSKSKPKEMSSEEKKALRRKKIEEKKALKKKKAEEQLAKFVEGHKANFNLPVSVDDAAMLEWHSKPDIKKQFEEFYNMASKTPKNEMQTTNIQELQEKLKDFMKKKVRGWCKRIEYTGSSYEGLKIGLDGLEYDMMFVMNGQQFDSIQVADRPGYAYLHQCRRRRSLYNKLLVEDSVISTEYKGKKKTKHPGNLVLSPELVISKFQSTVHRFIHSGRNEFNMKLRRHGPAIQLDVYKDNDKDRQNIWYSVDLVPCYELFDKGESVLFVPKPPKTQQIIHCNAWRRSYSREEKYKLTMNSDNKNCSKQVVRFLKGLSKQESTLNAITSYYWKTLLFHVMENDEKSEKADGKTWESINVHTKTFEMLTYMENCVKTKYLAQYFEPKMNLFADMQPIQVENISNRLAALCNNEKKFLEAIKKVGEYEKKGTTGEEGLSDK